jgi:murein L,D-transpeptidase YcbB/YkuD
VRRFQERHGLEPDGVVGRGFLRELNVPPADRLRTMLVNIERLRWVPERQPPDLILVNIPDFRLHVFDGGEEVLTMKVVVGARATHTVVFSDTLSQVVFSPTWTVPASIVRKEILPAIRRDPGYLRKHNMEIIGGSSALPEIRQKPGAENALGRIKFLFPNSFGIYMHDTPARSLFGAEVRAFSHGCIRVERPRALAEFLLRDDTTWTPERMTAAMLGEKELFVPLKVKRPVLIVYFTAWVDRDGQVNFRPDVYGHDAQLARELFVAEGP